MARTVTRRLRVKIDAQEQMSVTLQKIERNTKKFSDSLSKSLGFAAIKFQALAATASQFAAVANKIAQDAAIFKAFERQNLTIDKARKATAGLVDDMTLMLARNQEVALGLDLSNDQFAQMAEGAVVMGQAMGLDAAKAINDVTIGLARMSPKILDNLGITIKASEANRAYAEANGIVGRSLTENEKRLAFTADVMATLENKTKGASVAGSDFTNNWSRLTAEINNISTEFTKWAAASVPLAEMLDNITVSLRFVRDVLDDIANSDFFTRGMGARFVDMFVTGGSAAGTRTTRGAGATPQGGGGGGAPTFTMGAPTITTGGGGRGRRGRGRRGGGQTLSFSPEEVFSSSELFESGFLSQTTGGVSEAIAAGGGRGRRGAAGGLSFGALDAGGGIDLAAEIAQMQQASAAAERLSAQVSASFIRMADVAINAAFDSENAISTILQGLTQMLSQIALASIGGPAGQIAALGIGLFGGLASRATDTSRSRSGREVTINQSKARRRGLVPRSTFV